MIDFANIKTTPCGKPCHYFGMRIGLDGSSLHCFGVWNKYGVFEWCYNDAGKRVFLRDGKWAIDQRAQPIAPPPKRKVWAYYLDGRIWLSDLGPDKFARFDHCQEVEVP